jgi:hypothetical protein
VKNKKNRLLIPLPRYLKNSVNFVRGGSVPKHILLTERAVQWGMFVRDPDEVWHHEECSLVALRVENNRNQCANLDPEMPGKWCDHCLPDPN